MMPTHLWEGKLLYCIHQFTSSGLPLADTPSNNVELSIWAELQSTQVDMKLTITVPD